MSSFDVAAALELPELPSYIEHVEQKLERVLATDNPYIQEPLDRLLKARGKRLRPSLVIAVAASQGKTIDQKITSGCVAVELVHLASLVHDDVIDNANSRWNLPTINHQEGVNHAIIVGDYLLARALEQATSVSREVAQTIASAFAAMCDGQGRELADTGNPNRTQASYLKAINGKTAALFSAACRVGGLCADLPNKQTNAFASYGENFGMAFQLIDDVLDFIVTPVLFGKPVGTDIHTGVYTMPLLFGLEDPNGKKLEALLQEFDALATITDILIKDGGIEKSILETGKYNKSAARALINFGDATTRLSNFPNTYLNWALENLAAPIYQPAVLKILN